MKLLDASLAFHLLWSTERFYCEFSSGNRVIRIELGTEHPNAQIGQIQLHSEGTTKLFIGQPAHEGPVTLPQISVLESSIEMPTQTEFTLSIIPSNLQELLNNYLKTLQQLYDKSNNLKRLLSSHSAAIQRLISRFKYLNVLLNYPEIQQRLSNLKVGFRSAICDRVFRIFSAITTNSMT